MRQLIVKRKAHPNNIFYLNKKYLAFDKIKSANEINEIFNLYKQKINPTGKIYIFIDEVQNIKEWEKFENSYSQIFTDNYELFINGSNSKLLSGELATLLSGIK